MMILAQKGIIKYHVVCFKMRALRFLIFGKNLSRHFWHFFRIFDWLLKGFFRIGLKVPKLFRALMILGSFGVL